jgi:hypothetical protein
VVTEAKEGTAGALEGVIGIIKSEGAGRAVAVRIKSPMPERRSLPILFLSPDAAAAYCHCSKDNSVTATNVRVAKCKKI